LVNVYSSNLEQLQQQIQMYQNMYQNTLGIPIQAWSGIAGRLTSLVSTIQNTQGIVNATVNSITDMQTTYGNGNLLSNQQQNLMNWNKGLNNQIGAALQQLGYTPIIFQPRKVLCSKFSWHPKQRLAACKRFRLAIKLPA